MDGLRQNSGPVKKIQPPITNNTFGSSEQLPVPRDSSQWPQSNQAEAKPERIFSAPKSAILRMRSSGEVAENNIPVEAPLQQSNPVEVQQAPIAQTALLARRMPMDMNLPGEESPSRWGNFIGKTKWRQVHRVTTRVTAAGIVVIVLFGAFIFSNSYLKLNKIFRGDAPTAEALKPNVPVNLLNGQSSGRVNVLMLGRDGGGHANPDVTDSLVLASIDTINHTATLISLPSNLWVNAPGASVMKLSSAWQAGEFNYLGEPQPGSTNTDAIAAGYKVVDKTVNQITGLNVNYNILVNTQALEQAVNTVGGITLNIPTTLTDPTMAWENHKDPVLAKEGTQTLDGKQSFLYVTSEETTSNFSRESRQRDVIESLFNKIVSSDTYENPVKLDGLINTFGDNITTDLSLKNAGLLFNVIDQINPSNVQSLDLDTAPNQLVTNGNVNGEAVILPQAGLFNYSAIQKFVNSQLKNPYLEEENAKVLILNGTSTPGLATAMGSKLSALGYNVVGEANTPSSNWTTTSLFNITKSNKYTQHFLAQQLKLKVSNKEPGKSIPTDGADFVIIIGSNEANTSQN